MPASGRARASITLAQELARRAPTDPLDRRRVGPGTSEKFEATRSHKQDGRKLLGTRGLGQVSFAHGVGSRLLLQERRTWQKTMHRFPRVVLNRRVPELRGNRALIDQRSR